MAFLDTFFFQSICILVYLLIQFVTQGLTDKVLVQRRVSPNFINLALKVKLCFSPNCFFFTLGHHRRLWVLSLLHASICPSVLNEDVDALTLKGCRYRPEIWWGDAKYHEADEYLKWPWSANSFTVYELLNFPWWDWTSSERQSHCPNWFKEFRGPSQ